MSLSRKAINKLFESEDAKFRFENVRRTDPKTNEDGSPQTNYKGDEVLDKTKVVRAIAEDRLSGRYLGFDAVGVSKDDALQELAKKLANAGNPSRPDRIKERADQSAALAEKNEALEAKVAELQAKLSTATTVREPKSTNRTKTSE